MTALNWTGTISSYWNTAGNWSPAAVPGSGDTVTIGTVTNEPSLGASATISSLTIDSGVLTLEHIDVTLKATNGIALNSGTIVGEGSLFGAITSTGASVLGVSEVDTQNTPELNVFSTVTDNGNGLTLLIADFKDVLSLYAASSAHAVNFNGQTGMLELSGATGTSVGSLTVSSQMAVDAGKVFLDSSSVVLTDTTGILLTTGTLFGAGTIASSVTATGAAYIQANEGTLEVTGGLVDGNNALSLSLYTTGDKLVLDAPGQAAAAHSANLNNVKGTLELNGVSLTVGSLMAIGTSTVQLDGGASQLSDTSGITLSGGAIDGAGKVVGAITASGANIILANPGTLELAGNVIDSSNDLTLQANSSSDLKIDGNAAAHTVNDTGTIEISSTGTLTDNTNMVIGSGTVTLDGGGATLSDSTESLTSGTIIGDGLVIGVVTATAAAHIIAEGGGKLELENQLSDTGGLLSLLITTSSDTLQLDFSGVAHSVSFNGASGMLALTNQGTLTVGTQMSIGTGTVALESSLYELTDAAGVVLGGGEVEGVGKVNAAVSGTGTVLAIGGTLELTTAIVASAGPSFEIANGATSALQIDSTVGSGNDFAFFGNAGELILGDGAAFGGTIMRFESGDTIDLKGFTAVSKSYANETLTLTNASSQQINLTVAGDYVANDFTIGSDGSGGTLIQTIGPNVPSDFTGDEMSDLLLQYQDTSNASDPGNGDAAIWLMNGTTITSNQIVAEPGANWDIVGTGDFNDNGKADLVWQYEDTANSADPANGATSIWLMNGTSPISLQTIAEPGGNWHVVGTGDLTGTGDADLVWQYEDASNTSDPLNGETSVWLMNGTTPTSQTAIAQPGGSWHVVATGDFNGDGKSDLVWQYEDASNASDPLNGETSIWLMNGTTATSVQAIAQPGGNWHVVATGDFTGNGMSDLLWQYEDTANPADPGNGETSIWLMNGTTPTSEQAIAAPGANWHVIGTGDYNGDGKADILWQYEDAANPSDSGNGAVSIWLMNGTTPSSVQTVATPPASWHVL